MGVKGFHELSTGIMAAGKPITSTMMATLRDNIAGLSAGRAVSDFPVSENALAANSISAATYIRDDSIDGDRITNNNVYYSNLQNDSVKYNNLKISSRTSSAGAGLTSTTTYYGQGENYWLGYSAFGYASTVPKYNYGFESGLTAAGAVQWLSNTTTTGFFYAWVRERTSLFGAAAYISWTYITASPPHRLGGMDWPLFAFFRQGSGGAIRGGDVCDDPPWEIFPDLVDAHGRKFVRRPARPIIEDLRNPGRRDAALERLRNYRQARASGQPGADDDLVEVDQRMIEAQAAKRPHPMVVEPGERVVVLDPGDDTTHRLAELRRLERVPLAHFIHAGYLTLDESPAGAPGPPGVKVVRARWR